MYCYILLSDNVNGSSGTELMVHMNAGGIGLLLHFHKVLRNSTMRHNCKMILLITSFEWISTSSCCAVVARYVVYGMRVWLTKHWCEGNASRSKDRMEQYVDCKSSC